jgi:hypothetical protein
MVSVSWRSFANRRLRHSVAGNPALNRHPEGLGHRHVPAGDQDLAGDGGFGGVAVSLPAADVDVQSVPGVLRPPALLGRLDRRPT